MFAPAFGLLGLERRFMSHVPIESSVVKLPAATALKAA